jgi:hypothetical protein
MKTSAVPIKYECPIGFLYILVNIEIIEYIYHVLINFQGTKWCGAGNIADDENDFGEFRDTDKCCRNHDLCPDIIEGHQTKYNLTNPSFFTR